MKLANRQLKKIIAEELRSVLDEVMVDPTYLTKRALGDPQVDQKIKNLLRQKDPELHKQGLELLGMMYPDDYSFEEIDSPQSSRKYEKDFGDTMKINRDVAKLRGIKDFVENLPGNIKLMFSLDRGHMLSKDEYALEDALFDVRRQFGFSPNVNPGGGYHPYISQSLSTKAGEVEKSYTASFNMETDLEPQAFLLMNKILKSERQS